LGIGTVIGKNLHASGHASNYGMHAKKTLEGWGVNETVSRVAGAGVTVLSTPLAIDVAIVDKIVDVASEVWESIKTTKMPPFVHRRI
jgi:hypothetical protein